MKLTETLLRNERDELRKTLLELTDENDMLDTLVKSNIVVMKDASTALDRAAIVIRDLVYENKYPHERFSNAEKWLAEHRKSKESQHD
jgi:hypothetical protein